MVIHPFPKLSNMQIALALTALAAHKSHPEQEIMKVIKRAHELRIWCTGSFTQEQLKKMKQKFNTLTVRFLLRWWEYYSIFNIIKSFIILICVVTR